MFKNSTDKESRRDLLKRKDYLEEIIEYIKKNLKKGYTKDSLLFALRNQGYSRAIINKAFDKVDKELAETAPQLEPEDTKPKITYEIVEPKEHKVKITNHKLPWWKRFFD